MKKLKTINLIKTCDSFPAQWEGHLEDGRMFYIRFRSGILSLSISKNKTNDIDDAVWPKGNEVYRKVFLDNLDGQMTEKDMKLFLKDYIDFKSKQ